MSNKKDGMPYVVYPSPMKGKDGRKLLNGWTEGKNPKLLKTRQGSAYIYTEI